MWSSVNLVKSTRVSFFSVLTTLIVTSNAHNAKADHQHGDEIKCHGLVSEAERVRNTCRNAGGDLAGIRGEAQREGAKVSAYQQEQSTIRNQLRDLEPILVRRVPLTQRAEGARGNIRLSRQKLEDAKATVFNVASRYGIIADERDRHAVNPEVLRQKYAGADSSNPGQCNKRCGKDIRGVFANLESSFAALQLADGELRSVLIQLQNLDEEISRRFPGFAGAIKRQEQLEILIRDASLQQVKLNCIAIAREAFYREQKCL